MRNIAVNITTKFGILIELAVIIIIPEIISKTLIMLNPVINTIPFTSKISPIKRIKLLGIILKIPNNQKTIPIKISKIPSILIIIFKNQVNQCQIHILNLQLI